MSIRGETLHRIAFGGACIALVLIAFRAAISETALIDYRGIPAREELDSLHHYMSPVTAAEPSDDYLAFVPATEEDEPESRRPRAAAPARQKPVLSAILITNQRRVAIIDDQQVMAGSTLPGGARVLDIQPDYVVVAGPGGNRITLYPGSGEVQGE